MFQNDPPAKQLIGSDGSGPKKTYQGRARAGTGLDHFPQGWAPGHAWALTHQYSVLIGQKDVPALST